MTDGGRTDSDLGRDYVWALAALSALAVLIANLSGIATGDDGVGYRAIADSLLAGDGYGYYLEDPVTVWPPIWPGLLAAVAWLTPLDTVGAAIVLNAATAAGVVVAGNRLLRVVVHHHALVLMGTLVMALGPATVGLGHMLLTELAFALLTVVWMLALIRFHRSGSMTDLLGAAALAWVGFGLRYVGLVLIVFGGLWLFADGRRSLTRRLRDGVIYGVSASIVPFGWMLRNLSIDGTFTGERHPAASGLIENGFDVTATLGRFLLPGLGESMVEVWAAVGLLVLGVATLLAWQVLGATDTHGDERRTAGDRARIVLNRLGAPIGLIFGFAALYLCYMVYVRSTTALNQLDLRLLFPAYFPLMATALALVDRLDRLGADGRWRRVGWNTVRAWTVANVVAGLVAMTAFASGLSYFEGNYQSDAIVEARQNPALASIPEGCTLYSNLPNGLYPTYEVSWSPRRRAFESSREIPELERISETLSDTPSCLIWIDEPPLFAHLWTLEELDDRLSLELLDESGAVSVFRMGPSG